MNKKRIKRIIMALSISSFVLLLLPVFNFDADGMEYVVRGINLTEFSALGNIVLMLPLIILAILYSHMRATQKTVGIIAAQCVNLIGMHNSFCEAKEWVEQISSHYVRPEPYLFVYTALITLTLMLFYLYNECLGNLSFKCLSLIKNTKKE